MARAGFYGRTDDETDLEAEVSCGVLGFPTIEIIKDGSCRLAVIPLKNRLPWDQRRNRRITRMNWPAKSPDMMPLENGWSVLKLKVLRWIQPGDRTANQHRYFIVEWQRFPQRYLQSW